MKVESLRTHEELAALDRWLPNAVKRFGTSGYGQSVEPELTRASLAERIASPNALYAGMVGGDEPGLVIVEHSRWEESVIGRPFARVAFLGAETHQTALALLREAVRAMSERSVVLARASSGNHPGYVHVAFGDAGFYVASQLMTLSADIDVVWAKLARLPECRTCRFATPADADALVRVAAGAFTGSRFLTDPYFPAEWGNQLYAAWTRKLATTDEHRLVVVEEDGVIRGFGNVQRDVTKAPEAPGLFVVAREAQGSGLGALLLRRVIEAYRDAGSGYPLITTEKSNAAVNGLYFRLGFRLENVNAVYHWTPSRPLPGSGS